MSRLDRRSLLGYSFFGAGAALASGTAGAEAAVTSAGYVGAAPDRWIYDDTSAVADTESGKVLGYVRNDIRIFKGIPYGLITPAGRWQRAVKPKPWTGKRSSRTPGFVCTPITGGSGNPTQGDTEELAVQHIDGLVTHPAEDCLRLNVWTPGTDSKKRQVLFYCHGGGFTSGSSLMAAKWEAHNLAKYGDVVVVSMNHRLNVQGFLDLTAYGSKYAESANVGMLDIIDALKWVKANIANFGGDPDKVMIFGHSGGGCKVLTLLGMPETKGLFNRAVSHSPGPFPFLTPDQSGALAASFLKLVEVSPDNIDALHKLPLATLMRAASTIAAKYDAARVRFDKWNSPDMISWHPVIDGRTLLYAPTAPTVPSEVPLMVGTTLHERFGALGHPEYFQMPEAQAREMLRVSFGPAGDGMYDVYRGVFPKVTPFEIYAMAQATADMRVHIVKTAQARAALHAAPTYNFWVHWIADVFEGRALSHHEIEMPLVLMTSDEIPTVTGATPQARALSLKMADAWLAFARTGNPNTKALPKWDPVTPQVMNTMVFDTNCHIDHGSDLAAIDIYWKARFPKA